MKLYLNIFIYLVSFLLAVPSTIATPTTGSCVDNVLAAFSNSGEKSLQASHQGAINST